MTRRSTKLQKRQYYRVCAGKIRRIGWTLQKLKLGEHNCLSMVEWECRRMMNGKKDK